MDDRPWKTASPHPDPLPAGEGVTRVEQLSKCDSSVVSGQLSQAGVGCNGQRTADSRLGNLLHEGRCQTVSK